MWIKFIVMLLQFLFLFHLVIISMSNFSLFQPSLAKFSRACQSLRQFDDSLRVCELGHSAERCQSLLQWDDLKRQVTWRQDQGAHSEEKHM